MVSLLFAPFVLVTLLVVKFSYSKEEKKKFTDGLKVIYKESKAKKDKATKEPITSDKKDELNNQH